MPSGDDPRPRYDAVLVPQNYPPARTEDDRRVARSQMFGPLLGARMVHPRQVAPLHADLLTARGDAPSYYFPRLSPRAHEERYDWTAPDADGVRFGTLKPEEAPEPVAPHPGPAGSALARPIPPPQS